jgi:hypothetical protein
VDAHVSLEQPPTFNDLRIGPIWGCAIIGFSWPIFINRSERCKKKNNNNLTLQFSPKFFGKLKKIPIFQTKKM